MEVLPRSASRDEDNDDQRESGARADHRSRRADDELDSVQRTVERVASVYFESCRRLARAINRFKGSS